MPTITYPNGVVANTTYANGKPATMTVTVNGVTSNVVTGLTYEPFGGANGWTYGNGLVRGNDYDLDGRLTGISTTMPSNTAVLQSLTYGLDANDSITAITNGVSSSLTQSFGYDALTRLTSVSSASGNAAWTFDGNGNRMNQTTASSSVAYAIASSSNRMLAANARGFGFDALGNLTSDSGNGIAYHFDPFNRMDSSTKAGATTTYHVNPLGQRTAKATAGGSWSNFVYAPDGPLLAENGPAGATDYLWLGGELVGMVRNGTLYAIHTDQLGRPELVTDPNRNVVWRASNFAYDRTVTQDNIGGLNLGFPGQYHDSETGLWNNGFRDYDATLGRYVESDPLGLAAGVNTYDYALDSPLVFYDDTGTVPSFGPRDTRPIPGTTYRYRIDSTRLQPNQQPHAHIYDKNMKELGVINKDGTGSHNTCPSKLPKAVSKFLRAIEFLPEDIEGGLFILAPMPPIPALQQGDSQNPPQA